MLNEVDLEQTSTDRKIVRSGLLLSVESLEDRSPLNLASVDVDDAPDTDSEDNVGDNDSNDSTDTNTTDDADGTD